MSKETVTTRNGLLYYNGIVLSDVEGDIEARKNGYQFADQLVKALENNNNKGEKNERNTDAL